MTNNHLSEFPLFSNKPPFKTSSFCPGWVAQLVGASCHAPKKLLVRSLVKVHMGENQSMFFSLFLSLSLLSLSSVSKISKTYPWVRIKKKILSQLLFFSKKLHSSPLLVLPMAFAIATGRGAILFTLPSEKNHGRSEILPYLV